MHTVIRQHRLRIPQDEELFDELASVRLTSPPACARAAAAVLGLALARGITTAAVPAAAPAADWHTPLADVKLAANINAALAGSASPAAAVSAMQSAGKSPQTSSSNGGL